MEYPKFTRDQDKRFKLTSEDESEIVNMRQAGHAYSYIANHFGIDLSRAWQICMKVMEPEKWAKREAQRRETISLLSTGS